MNGSHKCHILSQDMLGIYFSPEIMEYLSSLATYEEKERGRLGRTLGKHLLFIATSVHIRVRHLVSCITHLSSLHILSSKLKK